MPDVPNLPHSLPKLPGGKAPRLTDWIATCSPGKPGRVGTAPFNVFWQHNSSTPTGAFPVSALNYPCGADWAIIPGSSPIVPPVWIGKAQPFQPPTNIPGGFIFGTAQDIGGASLANELAAAGVPISASGQILGAGADGQTLYTPDWWSLAPSVKNAAASIMQKHGAYPGAVWETDTLHWGYGNIGVGLPNNIRM